MVGTVMGCERICPVNWMANRCHYYGKLVLIKGDYSFYIFMLSVVRDEVLLWAFGAVVNLLEILLVRLWSTGSWPMVLNTPSFSYPTV